MKIKIDKEKIDKLSPEDAIPLVIKFRRFIIGKKKADGFTRLIFSINIFSWFILAFWNILSYVAIQLSDVIKENKGFSVNEIIRNNGREYGFEGQDFLEAITQYYFINIFVWIIIFIGLALMYRKIKSYTVFVLGGLGMHFFLMIYMIGFQYFVEDISLFDKALYSLMILTVMIHSALMKKEQGSKEEFSEAND